MASFGDRHPGRVRGTLSLWLVVARAWGGRQLAAGLALMAAMWVLPGSPVPVPGRGGIEAVVWPLAPTIVAAILAVVAAPATRDLELAAGRPIQLVKGGFVVAGLAGCAIASMVAVVATPLGSTIIWRNDALLVGLALGSAALLRPTMSWAPPVLLSIVTWLLGPKLGGDVERWAVLLHPADSWPAAAASAIMLVAGCLLFCLPRRYCWL
jgi:hypothetical protein